MTTQGSTASYFDPNYPHWNSTLRDGTAVLIRPISPHDAVAELTFIENLSAKSKRNRFLGQVAHPSEALIEQLTDVDYDSGAALVAIVGSEDGDRIVGVSRYALDPSSRASECAVVVADAWQGKGLGTALMQCLIAVARKRGLVSMRSVDLAENWEMRDLAAALGFQATPDPEDSSQVIHVLSLNATAGGQSSLGNDGVAGKNASP